MILELPPFLLGFMFTLILFAFSYTVVVVVKSLLYYILRPFRKKTKKVQQPKKERKKPSPVRSIEINPDEVDRIYVKKIS